MPTTAAQTMTPEFYLSQVIKRLRKHMGPGKLIGKNFSKEIAQKGDTVNISKRGDVTVQSTPDDGNDITFESPNDTTIPIVLNQQKTVAWAATERANTLGIQENLNRIEDAAIALAEDFENEICKLYTDAGAFVGNHGSLLSDALLLEARRAMNVAGVPKQGRIALVSDGSEQALLAIPAFSEADKRGDADALKEAELGRLRGFKFYCSNFIQTTNADADEHNMFFHPNAFAVSSRPLHVPEKGTGVVGKTMYDKETGLVFRYLKGADIKNGQTMERLDVLYGLKVIDPRLLFDVRTQH